MNSQEILIVGGYGVVGQRIAAELAPDYPDRVVLGGRTLVRAEEVAKAIGHGVRGRRIDIAVPSSIAAALEGVVVVISCIDQPNRTLLWAAIERGLNYTDITPHLTELGRGAAYDKIDAAARASGAKVVLGTGLVPGISNVMVRALADALDGVDEIETVLLLSASDVSGRSIIFSKSYQCLLTFGLTGRTVRRARSALRSSSNFHRRSARSFHIFFPFPIRYSIPARWASGPHLQGSPLNLRGLRKLLRQWCVPAPLA